MRSPPYQRWLSPVFARTRSAKCGAASSVISFWTNLQTGRWRTWAGVAKRSVGREKQSGRPTRISGVCRFPSALLPGTSHLEMWCCWPTGWNSDTRVKTLRCTHRLWDWNWWLNWKSAAEDGHQAKHFFCFQLSVGALSPQVSHAWVAPQSFSEGLCSLITDTVAPHPESTSSIPSLWHRVCVCVWDPDCTISIFFASVLYKSRTSKCYNAEGHYIVYRNVLTFYF